MVEDNQEIKISKRVAFLIKNMFSDKENGWPKTEKANQEGPKKKKEVQIEVQEKYDAERKIREE